MEKRRFTIDEGVDDELPVLLDQVVDISENSAIAGLSARCLLSCLELLPKCGAVDLPHGESVKKWCSSLVAAIV